MTATLTTALRDEIDRREFIVPASIPHFLLFFLPLRQRRHLSSGSDMRLTSDQKIPRRDFAMKIVQ
jgi:hypothetical protein